MPDPTTLATKIVRALWPSEFREQVLDARVETVREVLEREGLSDLEAKLSERESFLRQCEQLGQQRLSIIIMESGIEEAPYIASVMDSIDSNEAHVIDLEAKLEAKERELEDEHGRLLGFLELLRNSDLSDDERWDAMDRLATEKED